MNVQGSLMQARFIEIHQVYVKKNKVGYFANRGILILKNVLSHLITLLQFFTQWLMFERWVPLVQHVPQCINMS